MFTWLRAIFGIARADFVCSKNRPSDGHVMIGPVNSFEIHVKSGGGTEVKKRRKKQVLLFTLNEIQKAKTRALKNRKKLPLLFQYYLPKKG